MVLAGVGVEHEALIECALKYVFIYPINNDVVNSIIFL